MKLIYIYFSVFCLNLVFLVGLEELVFCNINDGFLKRVYLEWKFKYVIEENMVNIDKIFVIKM